MSIRDETLAALLIPDVQGLSSRQAALAYLNAGLMPHPWRVKTLDDGSRTKASAYFGFSFGRETIYNPQAPKGERGCLVDEDAIGLWRPSWRCGLAVSWVTGLFAIDVDDIDAFDAWELSGSLTTTAKSITGREEGGYHLLFDGREIGEDDWPRQGNIPGGQIKSNGFIAVEPSLHPSGNAYRWVRRRVADGTKVARALARWQASQNGHGKSRDRAKVIADARTAAPGLQHDSLRDYAWDLRIRDLTEHEALLLLRDSASGLEQGKRRGAWTDQDLLALYRTAMSNSAGVGISRGQEARDLDALADWDPAHGESPEDTAFWESRPVLRHIRDTARATLCAPWGLFGECLAEVLCHIPPGFQLPALVGLGRGSLNMLIAVAGDSGDGKGVLAATAEAMFEWEGITGVIEDQITRAPVGTGEGLNKIYGYNGKDDDGAKCLIWKTYSAIITIKEIDTLAAMASRQGSTITDQLRLLYDGDVLGFHYSDDAKRVIIPRHEYRGVVIAGVQPGKGRTILEDLEGGFPQRWLWLPAWDMSVPDDEPEVPAPLKWSPPESAWGPHVMEVCDAIREEVRDIRKRKLRRAAKLEESHRNFTRIKVAAGLALLDGRDAIGDEDWRLAGYVMIVSDRIRTEIEGHLKKLAHKANIARGKADGARAEVAEKTREGYRKTRIRLLVLKHTEDWIPAGVLRNKFASSDRGIVDEVVASMVRGHELVKRRGQYNRQDATYYRKAGKGGKDA